MSTKAARAVAETEERRAFSEYVVAGGDAPHAGASMVTGRYLPVQTGGYFLPVAAIGVLAALTYLLLA